MLETPPCERDFARFQALKPKNWPLQDHMQDLVARVLLLHVIANDVNVYQEGTSTRICIICE